jgi:hypothetical protein
VRARAESLRNTIVPAGVQMTVSRDYGQTAGEKAAKLIQKLAFATGSVIVLVGLALGRREAVIVGAAVVLTLTAPRSRPGLGLRDRVSLFALIFSIGIPVDDAIVVENIHRHQQLTWRPLAQIIPLRPQAGGLTIWRDRHRGAVADGLRQRADGPVHEADPINASLGMLLSLLIVHGHALARAEADEAACGPAMHNAGHGPRAWRCSAKCRAAAQRRSAVAARRRARGWRCRSAWCPCRRWC